MDSVAHLNSLNRSLSDEVAHPCESEQLIGNPLPALEAMLPAMRQEASRLWGRGFLRGESASDFCQSALAVAIQQINSFRGNTKAEMYAWLRTILGNDIRGSVRRHASKKRDLKRDRAIDPHESPLSSELTPSSIVANAEQAHRLQLYMEFLSPVQRLVIDLRVYGQLSHEEVGLRIGKSAEAARKLYLRAALKLQSLIERS
jgi:RNA polymerase sigma factor (sigma-70 family)